MQKLKTELTTWTIFGHVMVKYEVCQQKIDRELDKRKENRQLSSVEKQLCVWSGFLLSTSKNI